MKLAADKNSAVILRLESFWTPNGTKMISPLTGALVWLRTYVYTVKSWFNESRFNVKSQFKERNLVTKMKFHIKKSRFSVKSRFKEWKGAEGGHSLYRDFTV